MITSKIRQRLAELSSDFHTRLQLVEAKAHQMIEYSQGGSHLSFTPHGFSHITAVEMNYDWLLTDNDMRLFNAPECFCLICATLFHDALMIPESVGRESAARARHAERARDFLLKNRDLLGLSIHEADIIAEVIRGHAVESIMSLSSDSALGSIMVSPRKLAACLSMADLAHADFSRAPEIVFRHLELNEESAAHWKRHLQISGITRNGDTMFMSALTFSDDGDQAVEEYKRSVEAQLKLVRPYFDTILDPIRRVELSRKRLESALDQTLRFQANTPAILKVLIEGVYEREDVFVRELVQNSLDACLIRRVKQMRRNTVHHSKILLTSFLSGTKVRAFRIDDNGIGMDLNDIRDTVLWIGNSIANKADLTDLIQQQVGKNLIATFGIGLLSCFKVSNRIVIRSAKEGETPIAFELTSISDSVRPEKSHDPGVGTTIIVELSDEARGRFDAQDSLEHYFRLIDQADLAHLRLEWSPELQAYTRENLSKIAKTEGKIVTPYPYPNQAQGVAVEIAGDDYSGRIWLTDLKPAEFVDAEGTLEILSEGVFVCSDPTPDWLHPHLGFCSGYLNFSARSLNVPAGRDRVIKDDRFRSKAQEVRNKSFKFIQLLIEHTNTPSTRRAAAIVLAHIYAEATEDLQGRILKAMDEYQVERYRRPGTVSLSEVRQAAPRRIYFQYEVGRWVQDLTMFDGKQLYHKQDDVIELQAALLTQKDRIVLSTTRSDDTREKILEATLLSAYFKNVGINVVDLAAVDASQIGQRAKSLPDAIRSRIGERVKFVEVTGIPNKMSWKIGSELRINIAHPVIGRIYSRMVEGALDDQAAEFLNIVVKLLGYDFEGALRDALRLLQGGGDGARRAGGA